MMKKNKDSALLTLKKKWSAFYAKPYAHWLIASVFFLLTSWFFMGPALSSCTTTVLGGPSDATAGLGWLQFSDNHDPWWSHSSITNYPAGESLWQPTYISGQAVYLLFWLAGVFTNQICSLNIVVLIGYMTSALAMYGFVRWLTRRPSIGIVAGVAAAYVPYFQMKAMGHLTHLYQSVFTLFLWSAIDFWQRPSKLRAVRTSFLVALAAYLDGYFILIMAVLAALVIGALTLWDLLEARKDGWRTIAKKLWVKYRHFVVALVALVVFMAPLIIVNITSASKIQAFISHSRGNILYDAITYSVRPYEYFAPPHLSLFAPDSYKAWRVQHFHHSNPIENTQYVGITIMLLAAFALWVTYRSIRKKQDDMKRFRLVALVALVVVIGAAIMSLPPRGKLFGHLFVTPTGVLIHFTSKWRVMARFFIILDMAMVILASIGIYTLLANIKTHLRRLALLVAILILIVLEYLISPPWYVWNFQKDAPAVYYQLSKDASVDTIAEFPIDDPPGPYTQYEFTYQQVHKKNMVNAFTVTSDDAIIRKAIDGIGDPQTMPVLAELGVDVVTTYDINADMLGLQKYTADAKNGDGIMMRAYKVPTTTKHKFVLVAAEGFGKPTFIQNTQRTFRPMNRAAIIQTEGLRDRNVRKDVGVRFVLQSADGTAQDVAIRQNNKVVWRGIVAQSTVIEFSATSNEPIVITDENSSTARRDLFISDLWANE